MKMKQTAAPLRQIEFQLLPKPECRICKDLGYITIPIKTRTGRRIIETRACPNKCIRKR
jgi:hypothetical protein